ncbi:dihydrofolate reductase family protein [Catenulispora subtropica]|uniref:Dihydrofolate reductase family protein n=1 Tax=Catenulispora subtropica TaxID=450798 RepID=A0ABN2SYQ5_9ACTN
MRNLVIVEFLTVDGVMQGLGSPDEDTEGGFTHGGWGLPYTPAIHEAMPQKPSNTTAFLFGRKTYEKLAGFWPTRPDTDPMAAQLNRSPKYVATRTLRTFDWQRTQALEGELAEAVSKLKAEGEGDIVILGSGVLVQQLLRLDLVDELRLFLHPLLLGTGKRLFSDLPDPRRLKLTSSTATSLGTALLTYEVMHD